MDNFNPNQMPPLQATDIQKKGNGPLIAVILILIIIVVGGIYFFSQRMSKDRLQNNGEDAVTASLNSQSNSDDIGSIEADLNATDLNSLDQGASVIESQI